MMTSGLPKVLELHFSDTQQVMRSFVEHINKDNDHDNEELAALSALPLFTSIVNQLQTWGGDVSLLPEAEDLIGSINEYTNSLEEIMEKKNEH